jgi:hypothetical protein
MLWLNMGHTSCYHHHYYNWRATLSTYAFMLLIPPLQQLPPRFITQILDKDVRDGCHSRDVYIELCFRTHEFWLTCGTPHAVERTITGRNKSSIQANGRTTVSMHRYVTFCCLSIYHLVCIVRYTLSKFLSDLDEDTRIYTYFTQEEMYIIVYVMLCYVVLQDAHGLLRNSCWPY